MGCRMSHLLRTTSPRRRPQGESRPTDTSSAIVAAPPVEAQSVREAGVLHVVEANETKMLEDKADVEAQQTKALQEEDAEPKKPEDSANGPDDVAGACGQEEEASLLETLLPETVEEEPPPWGRFCILWFACSLACGVLPGQAVFVELFANAGVFASACGEAELEGGHDGDPVTCKTQFVYLTAIFSTGMNLTYIVMAPIGLLYDRYGARKLGTHGALMCSFGMALMAVSVVGAQMGSDAHFKWLFAISILVCDFGSMLNSFAFYGLLWHFPKRQALVLSLVNATYVASSFAPLVVQGLMQFFRAGLGTVMLGYAGCIGLTSIVCWKVVPTQAEFYAKAEAVLGMPLPPPPTKLEPVTQFRNGWKILKVHGNDHLASMMALTFGFSMVGYYSALASGYGEALFGSKADGERLAESYVTLNGLVGLLLAPFGGWMSDTLGLKALLVMTCGMQTISLATCGVASWTAQTVCTLAQVFLATSCMLFINRYFLLYSPPEQYGTVTGVYIFFLMAMSMPVTYAGLATTDALPDGPDAYRYPLYAYGALGVLAWGLYIVYFTRYPPPAKPPMTETGASLEMISGEQPPTTGSAA